MGVHWYARSRELAGVLLEMESIERRIFGPDADERSIDAALDARERMFDREREARERLARRGAAATLLSLAHWPREVAQHVQVLGPAAPDRPLLDLLGWGTDYYVENLRDAGVPMDGFSRHLDRLQVTPEQACSLGEEILRYASHRARDMATRHAREAGLWLYLWGSLDCGVQAGD